MKVTKSSPNGWKTLCQKEKLLVTSNIYFSHSVFKRCLMQTRKNQGLFGKELKSRVYLLPKTLSLTEHQTVAEIKLKRSADL